MKIPLYVEITEKVLNDTKRVAKRLQIPVNKTVELALKEFIENGPEISLSFKHDKTRKARKL